MIMEDLKTMTKIQSPQRHLLALMASEQGTIKDHLVPHLGVSRISVREYARYVRARELAASVSL
jgi:hypothetical protein